MRRTVTALVLLMSILPLSPGPVRPQESGPPRTLSPILFPSPWGSRIQQPVVGPGERVRVRASDPSGDASRPKQYDGTLLGWENETLRVETGGASGAVSLPFSSVSRLQVSRGRKGSAVWGAMIGAVGTFVTLKITVEERSYTPGGEGVGDVIGLGLVAIGGVLGAFIGSAVKRDRWETVPLDLLRSDGTER